MLWMRKYLSVFSMGLQSSMEYRWDFLLGILSIIFPLTIQFFLWTAIYKSSNSEIVYGYTYSQMLAYSILAVLTSKLIVSGFEWEVMEDIKNGGFSKFIVKPVGYLKYRLACFFGQKSFNLLVIFIIVAIVLSLLNINFGFETSFFNVVMFIISIILALFINFLIYFSLASAAFWINEATGVFVIANVVTSVISGGIFPLDIFGDKVLAVFSLLPFQYTIYFPVSILNGTLSFEGILNGLMIQALWITIMLVIANIAWKFGMKKYTAAGG